MPFPSRKTRDGKASTKTLFVVAFAFVEAARFWAGICSCKLSHHLLSATLARLLKLIEKPGRPIPFKSFQSMMLPLLYRKPDGESLSAKFVGLLLHSFEPIRVEFSDMHINAQLGEGRTRVGVASGR